MLLSQPICFCRVANEPCRWVTAQLAVGVGCVQTTAHVEADCAMRELEAVPGTRALLILSSQQPCPAGHLETCTQPSWLKFCAGADGWAGSPAVLGFPNG